MQPDQPALPVLPARIDLGERIVLQGELTLPRNPGGLVLFAHGSGSSRHSPRNRHVAELLHDVGLATLLFDLLAPHEDSECGYKRELRFDIELLAERLRAATDWVARHPETRTLRLGYFGASTGAAAALVAAAEPACPVRAIVSRGGRPDLAGPALARVRTPTLLIVGSEDEPVLSLNRAAARELAGEHELDVIPGAGHLFEEPGALDLVAATAARWFVQHLH